MCHLWFPGSSYAICPQILSGPFGTCPGHFIWGLFLNIQNGTGNHFRGKARIKCFGHFRGPEIFVCKKHLICKFGPATNVRGNLSKKSADEMHGTSMGRNSGWLICGLHLIFRSGWKKGGAIALGEQKTDIRQQICFLIVPLDFWRNSWRHLELSASGPPPQ